MRRKTTAASVEIEHALLDVRRDAHGVGFEVDACLGRGCDGFEEVTLEPFGVTMSLFFIFYFKSIFVPCGVFYLSVGLPPPTTYNLRLRECPEVGIIDPLGPPFLPAVLDATDLRRSTFLIRNG
jgi:hypothetical protein